MSNTGTNSSNFTTYKNQIISFLWQHLLLLFSIFIMTTGVALTIRSSLGSSVISSIPMAMSLAGEASLAPRLTVGQYTNIMNVILVVVQKCLLRRRFEKIQLLQLVIGTVFGWLIDLSMIITAFIPTDTLTVRILMQLFGCTILGFGIALELRCGSVTMPGEGVPAAMSKAFGIQFAKAKIGLDITLVFIAVLLGYMYFGSWPWSVVGPGTLFAMIFVGVIVKFFTQRIGWFDSLLGYRPGFRRYIYGLARYIRR